MDTPISRVPEIKPSWWFCKTFKPKLITHKRKVDIKKRLFQDDTEYFFENEPKVVNVSCTFSLGVEINFNYLVSKLPNVKTNMNKFHAVNIKLKKPQVSANIFKSGKVVLAGIKRLRDSQRCAYAVANTLREININAEMRDFKVRNIVGSGYFQGSVDLPSIHESLRNKQDLIIPSYEPELFPGLICRKKNSSERITIFTSGKYNITGCINQRQMDELFYKIKPFVDIRVPLVKKNKRKYTKRNFDTKKRVIQDQSTQTESIQEVEDNLVEMTDQEYGDLNDFFSNL